MEFCPKCGSHVPATSKFCPECGHALTIRTIQIEFSSSKTDSKAKPDMIYPLPYKVRNFSTSLRGNQINFQTSKAEQVHITKKHAKPKKYEVYMDGQLVGRNGTVGVDYGTEVPGSFLFVVSLPTREGRVMFTY
jgi:DNA-directed RNA polymerase subunit M/transcription elongation factor TFIIS